MKLGHDKRKFFLNILPVHCWYLGVEGLLLPLSAASCIQSGRLKLLSTMQNNRTYPWRPALCQKASSYISKPASYVHPRATNILSNKHKSHKYQSMYWIRCPMAFDKTICSHPTHAGCTSFSVHERSKSKSTMNSHLIILQSIGLETAHHPFDL